MRIGLISLGRRGSGGPLSMNLAVHLGEHSQVFAVVSEFAEDLAAWRQSGVDLLETPTYQSLGGALASWVNQPRLARLARRIREQQPDVLLFPIFHTWTPFLQRKLRPLPSVVVVHDPQPHPGDLAWILENVAIRQADRCILLSAALAPALEQRGVPAGRIDIIPHGPLYYPGSKPIAQPEPVILFFGRITRYKGLEILLQALQEVPQPHRLVIAGEGDLAPYRPFMEKLKNVEVHNRWIPDEAVGGLFDRATMVVLPYTSATQSGVLAVAAPRGLPVIATRSGGLPEQIEHGVSGLLVQSGSVSELSQAIRRLLEDPAYAARLGQALQRDFESTRSWEQIAPLYLASCRKALQGSREDSPHG